MKTFLSLSLSNGHEVQVHGSAEELNTLVEKIEGSTSEGDFFFSVDSRTGYGKAKTRVSAFSVIAITFNEQEIGA